MSAWDRRIELKDLPAKVEISLPPPNLKWAWMAGILGSLLFGFGLVSLVFGPMAVQDNVKWSKCFAIVQAYPGILLILGMLTVTLARFAYLFLKDGYMGETQNILRACVNITEADVPDGFTLAMEPQTYPHFVIKLIPTS
ncbi:hypothetical protein [Pseudomonas sp. Marseille-QA0892]